MGSEEVSGEGLNPYQKNSLTVRLRRLEKALDRIEELLAGDHEGILYGRTTELSAERRQNLAAGIAGLREQIREVSAEFRLAADQEEGVREIVALLNSSWESLEDGRPDKLRRYGHVDPLMKERLDPYLERIIHSVLDLERITNR